MEDCVFCKIIKKEIPCAKVYEDDNFLAFLDIRPISHGHTLVIPKKHVVWMQEADDETIGEIFKLSKKLMLAIKTAMKADYVQLGVVGKDVPHFHIHLTPRYYNDGFKGWPTKEYKDTESSDIAKKITQAL